MEKSNALALNHTQHYQALRTVNKRLPLYLVGGAIMMFIFALFIMPPMYEVFCEITGLNGRSDNLETRSGLTFTTANTTLKASQTDQTNTAPSMDNSTPVATTHTIQFLADTDKAMPWEFKPTLFSMKIAPGQRYNTTFYAKNPTGQRMTAHAVPSVSPGHMAQYLKKMECFCFNEQILEAGESIEMPLSFSLSEDAPDNVSTLTLSYMLYRTDTTN